MMDFNGYPDEACVPIGFQRAMVRKTFYPLSSPVLGLAGETGQLLSEYKNG